MSSPTENPSTKSFQNQSRPSDSTKRLQEVFGDRVRPHVIDRRDNQDVPSYLSQLREARRRAENSRIQFG